MALMTPHSIFELGSFQTSREIASRHRDIKNVSNPIKKFAIKYLFSYHLL